MEMVFLKPSRPGSCAAVSHVISLECESRPAWLL